MLAVAGCVPATPLPLDFVRALEKCPASIETCVPLIASYTDKDPAIIRITHDETRVTDVRRVIVGRLNGGAPQPIELRFRSPEAALMDDDYGTFAAIGADTILTTHGPLELPAGSLNLIFRESFLLIDTTNDQARWVPAPGFFYWHAALPTEPPDELWLAFDAHGETVWRRNGRCYRLPPAGLFVALPAETCRPVALRELPENEALAVNARIEAQGFDPDLLDSSVYRIEGMPYLLRFGFPPDAS